MPYPPTICNDNSDLLLIKNEISVCVVRFGDRTSYKMSFKKYYITLPFNIYYFAI